MAEYRPSQVTDIILDGKDDKNKITLEIHKVQKEDKSTERALAGGIVLYRRAMRSHPDLLGKIVGNYMEGRDIACA